MKAPSALNRHSFFAAEDCRKQPREGLFIKYVTWNERFDYLWTAQSLGYLWTTQKNAGLGVSLHQGARRAWSADRAETLSRAPQSVRATPTPATRCPPPGSTPIEADPVAVVGSSLPAVDLLPFTFHSTWRTVWMTPLNITSFPQKYSQYFSM